MAAPISSSLGVTQVQAVGWDWAQVLAGKPSMAPGLCHSSGNRGMGEGVSLLTAVVEVVWLGQGEGGAAGSPEMNSDFQ